MRGYFGLSFATVLAAAGTTAVSAQEITGTWNRGDGNARVAVTRCGEAYCATNVWIRDPASGEKVGDILVMNVKPKANGNVVLAGTAYDPQRKLNLSATVSIDGDRMTTRGCVLAGLLCKSMNWTRAK